STSSSLLRRTNSAQVKSVSCVSGPATDFTWAEFVRRNNDELVNTWGNLVNRTVSMIAKNIGDIPPAGDLTDTDHALLERSRAAFGTVGGLIERHRQKQAIGEAMRVAADANAYLSEQAPWKLRNDDPDRMRTVLHVAAQVVDDCNRLLAPFLPHSAEQVAQALGHTKSVTPGPEIREVDDLDGGPAYPVITGDYSEQAPWESRPLDVGTPLQPPKPIFAKLESSVVDEELARLEEEART
ncbi:MAG TPA: class I tRNA ligase family protein, partial [Nocardioidaceae bacterium]|nr:class I tRNA ligase family protein [Nocardioidaceae bacterium]